MHVETGGRKVDRHLCPKSKIAGEVRDRVVMWEVLVDEEGQQGKMTFEGTLDEKGTTIRGTCVVYDGPTGRFTAVLQR